MTDNQQPPLRKVSFSDGSSTELRLVRAEERDAPAVLCLPAMGVRAEYYEVLADVFADEGFNVALADLRGNGTSSVRPSRRTSFGYADILEMELPAIVDAVREEFGTEQVMLVGHSLGGQMALLFSATASQRVSHTVLIASGSSWYRRVPGLRSAGWFLGVQLMFAITLLWGHFPRWVPFAGQEARRLIRDWCFEAMTGRYRVSRSTVDYESALAESTVPTLFVTIAGDPYVPRTCTEHLAGRLAAAKVAYEEISPERLRLGKPDHFRWVVRPQAVVDTVKEWFHDSSTDGAGHGGADRTTTDGPRPEGLR